MSSYTYKKITDKAKTCKNNIEKKGKLGVNSKWSYYFAKSIITPNKDVKKISFNKAESSTGNSFNKSIKKAEYTDMAKRLIKFVEKNKQLPNYVSYGNYKISVKGYTYLFANAIVNKYPSTVKYNTNYFVSQKKYGHATKSGCDNMGQNTGYYCACHSLQEVIRNLYGIVVPQKTIASWAGTTSAGTSHQGIRSAVAMFNKKYAQSLKIEEVSFGDLGWKGIKKIVDSKDKDCIIHNLYRRQYGHYEVVNNVSSNVTVQNSLGSSCGACYCGYIEYRTQSEYNTYISGISQKSILVFTRG